MLLCIHVKIESNTCIGQYIWVLLSDWNTYKICDSPVKINGTIHLFNDAVKSYREKGRKLMCLCMHTV